MLRDFYSAIYLAAAARGPTDTWIHAGLGMSVFCMATAINASVLGYMVTGHPLMFASQNVFVAGLVVAVAVGCLLTWHYTRRVNDRLATWQVVAYVSLWVLNVGGIIPTLTVMPFLW